MAAFENALIRQFNNSMDGFMEKKPTIQSLTIEVDDSGAYIRQMDSNSNLNFVRYKQHPNGCVVKTENEQMVVEEVDFISKAFEDLSSSLEAANYIIPQFGLILEHNYFNRFVTYPVHDKAVRTLSQILSSKSTSIKVESLQMHCEKLEQILQILPYLHPTTLKRVSLVNIAECVEKLEIEELMRLPQWKQVKEMEIVNWTMETSIRTFGHLERGGFQVERIFADDVVFMKEAAQQSRKELFFNFNEFEGFDKLSSIFGPPLTSAEQKTLRKMWFFKIEGNEKKVLNLNITQNSLEFCYVGAGELIFLHNPDNICSALNCVCS